MFLKTVQKNEDNQTLRRVTTHGNVACVNSQSHFKQQYTLFQFFLLALQANEVRCV